MYGKYAAQIEQIISRTEKEAAKNNKADMLPGLTMCKLMVRAMSKYVEQESKMNPDFANQLGLEHKSAERMLKYVFGKAQKLAIKASFAGVNGSACCLPDDVVFDWINDYYFLDDKEEYEKEQAEIQKKKEEEAKRKAEEAEKEKIAREKAIAKLSKEEGWETLSEDEKEKKIQEEAKKIKPRLGKKSTSKKKKEAAKAETKLVKAEEKPTLDEALESVDETLEAMADSSTHVNMSETVSESFEEKKEAEEAESDVFAPTETDGDAEDMSFDDIINAEPVQFTLFDLMGGV